MSLWRILLWPLRKNVKNAVPKPATVKDHSGFSLEKYEQLNPVEVIEYQGEKVIYCTPNRGTAWRVHSLFTKEPDTIRWIASFEPEDVLIDIGANVGMYTIWAAKTRGMRVYAFEPESQNYALLNKNIHMNSLSSQVMAYCVALSDESEFSELYLSGFQVGGSCHTFGEEVDFKLEKRNSSFAQGCFSTTLDQLVEGGVVPHPTHIKIDVDGLEHKVIKGCANVLRDPKLRSVLVEINGNLPEHQQVVNEFLQLGFSYESEQVALALRQEGAFKGVGNYVFTR